MLRKREEQRGEKDKEEDIGRERKWDTVKDGDNGERVWKNNRGRRTKRQKIRGRLGGRGER